MNSFYPKKVIDLMRNPKNMGEIKDADGVATVGNPVCGDVMRLYIKIGRRKAARPRRRRGEAGEDGKQKEEYIKNIKFQTLGCAAAIATSSILTEMAKGKTLKKAQKIKSQEIVKKLGGLPKIKLHCSLLAVEALKKAIKDYRMKSDER
jgi:nitrogen fixation NifU-like protein